MKEDHIEHQVPEVRQYKVRQYIDEQGGCNTPGSVLCRFERSCQIRIITILGRPPGITCTSQHTRYAGGIVMIITTVLDGTQKEHIYNNDSPSQEQQGYNRKVQNNNRSG